MRYKLDKCPTRYSEGGQVGDIQGWFNRSWLQYTPTQFEVTPEKYLPQAAFDDEWTERDWAVRP